MLYNKIYNIDCAKGMKLLFSESIDLCVTSPPYKDEDGFSPILIQESFMECYRILKKNSLLFVNFGHLANFKSRPFKIVTQLESIGFQLNDTIIWQKVQYRPLQGNKRVNNLTEFIFLFYKGKMPNLNRMAVGKPYEDKTNITRYGKGKDLVCSGNIWRMPYEVIQKKEEKLHNDRFCEELPTRCIKLSNIPRGSLVLDFFSGSATTAVAARNLGMNFIGFEKDIKHWETGNRRLGI